MTDNAYLTEPNYSIKELHVVQRNRFIRGKKTDLSITESKFIRFVIAQISKDEDIEKTYSVSLSKLIQEMKISRADAYRDISAMVIDIMQKIIYVETGKDKQGRPNFSVFHWFDRFDYEDGQITVRISESLRDFLICSRDFTNYHLSDVLELSTDRAIKLYELIMSWGAKPFQAPDLRYKGIKLADNEIYYEMDFLRKYFNCEDKYPVTKDFMKRVIDYNLDQIQKKACIDVTYRAVKEGQKTVALIFRIGNGGREIEQ